jgi:hypothetical protein
MTRTAVVSIAVVMLLAHPAAVSSQTFGVQGQLSSWFIINDQQPSTPGIGLRYLPTLTVEKTLPAERSLGGELSMNGYASAQAPDWQDLQATSRLKPYRVWARFKTSRFEARIGLQRINFGSATLLRPLMWFDSVDPRDPLQITDGVYGALLRHYLPNNVTVWAWGLYGNNRPKGWETSPAAGKIPEFGGRVHVPVSKGELAFTTHHRRTDFSKGLTSDLDLENPVAQEGRYALDGKWDLGIGIWFEGVLTHQTRADLAAPDQGALNVGADYTFGAGNGLHILGEYFVLEQSRGVFGESEGLRLAAVSLRYPIGLLDTLSAILYVDSSRHDAYRFINWQRSYDRWQFYVMGFWNPQQRAIYQGHLGGSGQSPLTGRGLQIMAVFNH